MSTDLIRAQLARRMDELGLSAHSVGAAVGVEDAVRRYLLGHGSIRADSLELVLIALGWSGVIDWKRPPAVTRPARGRPATRGEE